MTDVPTQRPGLGRRALLGRSAAVAGLAGATSLLSAAPSLAAPALPALDLATWDVGVLGDSLSSHGVWPSQATGTRTGGLAYLRSDSYLAVALPLTRGRFGFSGAWATGGFRSDQVLATHLPEVLAAKPAFCVVLMGTNDIGQLAVEQTRDSIRQAVTALMLAGITPILGTIPPKDTVTAAGMLQLNSLNMWLRAHARARGLLLVDFHAALVNPITGRYAPGLVTADGIHPTWPAVTKMGRALAAVLNTVPGASPVGLLDSYTPQGALLTDATHSTGTSWSAFGQGVYSQRNSVNWVGCKSVVTLSAGGEYGLYGGLASQPVAGHRIQFASIVDVPVVPAGGQWSFALLDRARGTVICGHWQCIQPLTNPEGNAVALWEFDMPTLPPGSEVVVYACVRGAAGLSLGAAQTTLIDLTDLGVG